MLIKLNAGELEGIAGGSWECAGAIVGYALGGGLAGGGAGSTIANNNTQSLPPQVKAPIVLAWTIGGAIGGLFAGGVAGSQSKACKP